MEESGWRFDFFFPHREIHTYVSATWEFHGQFFAMAYVLVRRMFKLIFAILLLLLDNS